MTHGSSLPPCDCVQTHSPAVGDDEIHHIWPKGAGGPDTPENMVNRCPTTHDNIHIVERLWRRHKGKPPWESIRRFNRSTRELGRRAYESSVAGRLVP